MTAGLLFSLLGIVLAREAIDSSSWPSAEGTVIRKNIHRHKSRDQDGRLENRYKPEIEYIFTANGTQYRGDRVSIGARSYESRAKAAAAVKHLQLHATCTVFYNPDGPRASTLETGLKSNQLLFVALGLMLIICGLLGGWIMYSRNRRCTKPHSRQPKKEADRVTTGNRVDITPPADSLGTSERDAVIRKNLTRWGREHIGSGNETVLDWAAVNIFKKGHLSYVEVEPHPKEAGYGNFIFVISFKRPVAELIATYCLEGGEFLLFSSTSGHGEKLPEKL